MPNHVRNVWKIKNLKPEKVQYVLDKLAVKTGTSDEEYIIDFDLIIPEPRLRKDCPKNCLVNSDSHVESVEGREWFNWYNFHNAYWGTKWNAYDGYTKIGKTQIIFVFSTAWSFPIPIAEKLADMGYDLDISYADEDLGSNCGKITVTHDSSGEQHWTNEYNDTLPNPRQFANYIWNHY